MNDEMSDDFGLGHECPYLWLFCGRVGLVWLFCQNIVATNCYAKFAKFRHSGKVAGNDLITMTNKHLIETEPSFSIYSNRLPAWQTCSEPLVKDLPSPIFSLICRRVPLSLCHIPPQVCCKVILKKCTVDVRGVHLKTKHLRPLFSWFRVHNGDETD